MALIFNWSCCSGLAHPAGKDSMLQTSFWHRVGWATKLRKTWPCCSSNLFPTKKSAISEFSWSSYTAQPSFFPGHNSAELSGAWKGISETHVPERLWLARLVGCHRNRNLLLVRKDPPHLQQAPIWTLESIAIRPFLHCLQKGEGKNMERHRFILWSAWGANSASQIQNMVIRSLEVLFKSTCCSLELSEASICYVFWGGDITKTDDVSVYARRSLRLDL